MSEEKITPNEEQLFDLLDKKNFNELSSIEKKFVLQHWPEEKYNQQRLIILQSKNAFSDDSAVLPLPLSLPTTKTIALYKRKIGFYQIALAAAAIVIFFLLITPNLTQTENPIEEKILVQRDTVTIEKEIHDTVVIEKLVPKIISEKVYVQNTTYDNCQPEELRLLETGPVRPISIDAVLTDKNGKSIKDDELKIIVNDLNLVSDVIGR